MKNKIFLSILGLSALFASASCEKHGAETLLPGANLSIRLSVDGGAMTRTSGGETVEDLESESAISSLAICLIKKDGLSGESLVTTISAPEDLAWEETSVPGVYKVNAIVPDTCTGEHLLYVVANKPSWMTFSKYGQISGTFNDTADNMAECWSENSFLMVNKQDAVTTSGDQAGVTVNLSPTGDKAEAEVTIERLATKVLVKENLNMNVAPLLTEVLCSGTNPGVDPDIHGAIAAMEIEQYALFNCVNTFNLIQRWNTATGSGAAPQLLASPSYSTEYDMDSGYYDNVPGSLVFKDLGTPLYCMENNSPYYSELVDVPGDATPGTKMKGRVTGLVFKAKAGYAKTFNGSTTIKEPVYVEEIPVEWTKAESNGNSDIIFGTLYQYRGNYYGDISCLIRNNASLSTLGTTATTEQLREAGVKVYEGGCMYYNYWIEDSNYTDGGKNYLSVMRNTFYDITITAINSLGDEFPCGGSYNKSDPISVDVPKLKVEMDIPDWEKVGCNYTIQ